MTTDSTIKPRHLHGQEGVYYVEGVGYCTGLAWAEENARGGCAVRNPDGSVKKPVWKEWDEEE